MNGEPKKRPEPDKVELRGGVRKSVVTYSREDATLEKGWSDDAEENYPEGAKE